MTRKHWFDYRPQQTEQHKIDNCSCCQQWLQAIEALVEQDSEHIQLWHDKVAELVHAIEDDNDDNLDRFHRAFHIVKKWLGWEEYIDDRVEAMRDKQ